MVVNCVAYGCKTYYSPITRAQNIRWHSFPFKRPEILKLWIAAIRRKDWKPSRTSKLCSQHFTSDDYQTKPGASVPLLKMEAVPSIFNFPKHLEKPTTSRRVLDYKSEDQSNVLDQEVENMIVEDSPQVEEVKEDPQVQVLQKEKDAATQTNGSNSTLQILRRKIRTLQQKVRRRDKKITSIKILIEELKKNACTTDNLTAILENFFEGFPLELLVHQFNNEGVVPSRRRYTDVMKQFVHTLYFYSPKAYNFVRQHFVLPNPRTIRKWLSSINCYPGFIGEVLNFLKIEVTKEPSLTNCSLIIDAMSIRKQIIWDNVKGTFVGNVDFGGVINIDQDTPASEALFFQIVSYSNKYKCPVGYFLIDKADANVQKELILCCLANLFEIGITVRSITVDGTATNLRTFKNLGCNLNIDSIKTYFFHPCSKNTKVYCIMDPCHMLKLARNCMAEKRILSESGYVDWKFLESLNNLQCSEHLKLANSLSSNHIFYSNKIMNVKLAAQTLSSSVANALAYLESERYAQFQDCAATVTFIKTINKIFDILNARNPYGKGFKSPIRPESLEYISKTFNDASDYLKSLKIDNIPLTMHARKTFAIGFITSMTSILELAKDLFDLKQHPLKYFLPYKCSQDHIELYFSCLRSRGGWNNNPNVMQLRWALRQMLFKNSIKSSTSANCADFDIHESIATYQYQRQTFAETEDIENDENVEYLFSHLMDYSLSEYKQNVLYYISGFIAKKIAKKLDCIDCINILFRNKNVSDHTYASSNERFNRFTNFITNGGLAIPSNVVFSIIEFVEIYFNHLKETVGINTHIKNLIQSAAKHKYSAHLNLFQPAHPIGTEEYLTDLHELVLVQNIVNEFLKCRMPHEAKLINGSLHGKTAGLRQKLTKLILFHNL